MYLRNMRLLRGIHNRNDDDNNNNILDREREKSSRLSNIIFST